MQKILTVGSDSEAMVALVQDLEAAAFDVDRAPDGFYAVLWLERNQAATIIVVPPLPDIGPETLAGIFRAATDLRRLPKLVLATIGRESLGRSSEGLFDLVAPSKEIPTILTGKPSPPPKALPEQTSVAGFQGTLEAIDFAHLVQILADTRRAGVLRISFEASEALVFFLEGEITHCLWGGREGLRAFRAILQASASGGARFEFETSRSREALVGPRTLGGPVTRLLLEVSVDLDGERRAVASPASRSARRG